MPRQRTVVIAIDESEHSEYAFDFYVNNIYREGDRIVLVHVPEYGKTLSTSSLLTDPNIVAELLKDNEERIGDLVENYSLKMKDKRLSGHVKQQCGKPGEAIIEVTREEGAQLLIVGSRGMGTLRRTFTGSVSDYCLHHSHVPVIICRHKTMNHSVEDQT